MRWRLLLLVLLVLVLGLDQTESRAKENRRGKRKRHGEGKTKGGRHKPLKILMVPAPSNPSGPEPPLSDPSGSEPPLSDPSGSEPPLSDPSGSEPPLSDPSGPEPPLSDPGRPESSDSAVIGPQPDGLIVELFNTEPEPSFSSEPVLSKHSTLPEDIQEKWEQQQKKKDEARQRKKRRRQEKQKKREEQALRIQVKKEQDEWGRQEEAELKGQEEVGLRGQEEAELRGQEKAELRKAEEEVQVWLRGDVFDMNPHEEETTEPAPIPTPPTRHEAESRPDPGPAGEQEKNLEEVFHKDLDPLEDLDLDPALDWAVLPPGCDISDVTASCENAKLLHFPPLSIPELKSLSLEGNNISFIPVEAFNGIPNLEWINLKKNRLTSEGIHPNAFKGLKLLTRLYLDGNLLDSVPSGLPSSLQELKINENRLKGLHQNSLQGLKRLVTLELEGNLLSEGGVDRGAFRDLSELSYLRLGRNLFRTVPQGLPPSLLELYLEQNRIEEISETVFNKTQSLTLVSLRHNRLDESHMAPLAWIHHRTLESLDLSHNELHLVPSFLPRSLVHLVLVGNHIERIPGYVFAHMEPGLEYLYLSYNKLDGEGVEPESFFGSYHSMVELCLDHNQLINVPSGINEMNRLHFLRLDNNRIRSVPEESLCDPNGDSTLAAVRLDNNYIDVETVSPSAFSCVQSSSSVVLKPQLSLKSKHQTQPND